jgi:hypothetical protein
MAEHDEASGWKSSSPVEAVWKDTKERIASRNADARLAQPLKRPLP